MDRDGLSETSSRSMSVNAPMTQWGHPERALPAPVAQRHANKPARSAVRSARVRRSRARRAMLLDSAGDDTLIAAAAPLNDP
jgi:hypothetical protein